MQQMKKIGKNIGRGKDSPTLQSSSVNSYPIKVQGLLSLPRSSLLRWKSSEGSISFSSERKKKRKCDKELHDMIPWHHFSCKKEGRTEENGIRPRTGKEGSVDRGETDSLKKEENCRPNDLSHLLMGPLLILWTFVSQKKSRGREEEWNLGRVGSHKEETSEFASLLWSLEVSSLKSQVIPSWLSNVRGKEKRRQLGANEIPSVALTVFPVLCTWLRVGRRASSFYREEEKESSPTK